MPTTTRSRKSGPFTPLPEDDPPVLRRRNTRQLEPVDLPLQQTSETKPSRSRRKSKSNIKPFTPIPPADEPFAIIESEFIDPLIEIKTKIIKESGIYNLKQNLSLIVGLFLFGIGSMILLTQLEHNSPMKSMLEASVTSVQHNKYIQNTPIDDVIKELSLLGDDQYSLLIVSMAILLILLGGYFYLLSKTLDTPTSAADLEHHSNIKDNIQTHAVYNKHITINTPTATPTPTYTTTNAASEQPTDLSTNMDNDVKLPPKIYDIFIKQVEIYKRKLQEKSIQYNLYTLYITIRAKRFRIISIILISILFYMLRILYTHRIYLQTNIQYISINIGKISLLITTVIILTQGSIYYIYYYIQKHRIITYLSNTVKHQLKYILTHNTHTTSNTTSFSTSSSSSDCYPIEFMEEDVVELVAMSIDNYARKARQRWLQQQIDDAATTTTTSPTASQVTPYCSSKAPTATTTGGATATNYTLDIAAPITSAYLSKDELMLPVDLVHILKPHTVRQYWREIEREVNKDKRIQVSIV